MADDRTDDASDGESIIELDIPDGLGEAERAVEVFRAWVADGALHVIFKPGTFADVADWGRLLADCARHLATAAALDGQMDADTALRRIDGGFKRALQGSEDVPEPTRTGTIKRPRHH